MLREYGMSFHIPHRGAQVSEDRDFCHLERSLMSYKTRISNSAMEFLGIRIF
jgi:hypothetical protein